MKKKIEMTFGPEGEVTLKTEGFSGKECQEASRFLEQALGSVTEERLTGEYYEVQIQDQVRQKHE